FQAEDGIRDRNVTGVQTCALPICGSLRRQRLLQGRLGSDLPHLLDVRARRRRVPRHLSLSRRDAEGARRERAIPLARRLGETERSEERRVGKEWKARWCLHESKKE